MRKYAFLLYAIYFLPAAVYAGEITVFDISESVLTLSESTVMCMVDREACTKTDVAILQEESKRCLRDILSILLSGDTARLQIKPSQVQTLSARFNEIHTSFVHISLLDGACNWAIIFFDKAFKQLSTDLFLLWGLINVPNSWLWLVLFPVKTLAVGALLIVEFGYVALTCFGMLTCLFWWL